MHALSTMEGSAWDAWKIVMTKAITKIPRQKPIWLEGNIRKGITELKQMPIVTKLADKNLGMVPIRGELYNRLLHAHLTSDTYTQVHRFPLDEIVRRLKNIVNTSKRPQWQKEMWLKDADSQSEPCPFYVIPKLHKIRLSSRPITAQHSYVLAPMSIALAKVLQIEVDQITEIAKDSKTVMQQLEKFKCSKQFVFMTYDVEQLYPSIDLHDAIKTLQLSVPIMKDDRNFWTKVLQLIMFNNYVSAEGKIFRQMKGTATGTQVAPPFANLYLYHKLKNILKHPKIQYNSRFIDDGILLIDDEETALEIGRRLNNACGLKFTFAINRTQATYLDITVYKGPRYELHRKLDTKVFFKATNKLLYLPAISHHPGIQKTGVIIGEAIRCLRNTSDKAKWLNAMNWIFKGLRQRGYSGRMIQHKFRQIRFEDRMKYITGERNDSRPKQITVMTQFNKETRHYWRKLLRKYPLTAILKPKRLGILNKKQKSLISDWPPQVIFKDFAKIGKALISAKQAFVSPSSIQPNA
jgi:hypothetical protein